ncbi:hypothetical protein [Rummeliibacillus stabekisii]|uniref:hypothetical protein n=1 Tax=Rummeliibacillus stabekisii TaxID=241244 RepID=UPI002041D0E9|nr:hypothetical protein [Rummeliibacillus stabekisii]
MYEEEAHGTQINIEKKKPANDLPVIGREEINNLVYRLKNKLGEYAKYTFSVPLYGCIPILKVLKNNFVANNPAVEQPHIY